MKKPEEPFKSGNFIHCHEFEDENIISKTYVHPDCMERFNEQNEDEDEEDKLDNTTIKEWWYETDVFSLQEIMNKIPSGVDPKQVIISIHRDRQIDHITVDVSVRSPTDKVAWQAGHDAEEVEYQVRRKQYESDLAEYEEWQTKQDIKKLEEKLAKLKK